MYQVNVGHHGDGPGRPAQGHAAPRKTVAFGPDGSCHATGSYDGRVILWDRATQRPRWTGEHSRLVDSVAFAPSGKLLASAGADKVCCHGRGTQSRTGADDEPTASSRSGGEPI